MNPQQEYLRRLADIDATVASAQIDPDVVLERAAGLLAGRAGCRITEAHAQLLQFASEQGRDPGAVAADVVAGLESQLPVESARVRALVGDALRPPRRRVGDRLPPVPERATASPVADDGGWRRVMQQVLDALPGNNTVVLPLRNPAGQVEDFAFV
ncbi:MAG: hypothetical protein QOE03_2515, partial [Micromonosporaceae bacterium]|nr:hypothetical protein [Micromonosporaceae bacterium]